MDVNKAVSLYCNESEPQQVKFLSRLGHQITVFARDTYEIDGNSLSDPVQLRCINEMMHRILGQQFKLLLSDNSRYPDDLFIKMIFEMAVNCHFENYLNLGITDSFKFLRETNSAR